MKTFRLLTLMAVIAGGALIFAPTESPAQSSGRKATTTYRVKVKHPLTGAWMLDRSFRSRQLAERRKHELEHEYWVIYHRHYSPKRFRSAPSRQAAHKMMWQFKRDGYHVSKKQKHAEIVRERSYTTYTVRVTDPLSGRLRSSLTYNSYADARKIYDRTRSQYWVIIKPLIGEARYEHGGTQLEADLKAVTLSAVPGQGAYSKKKAVSFSTQTRKLP